MRKGVVFLAFNNQTIDYLSLAEIAASKVKKYLGADVGTAIITDSDRSLKCDHQINIERSSGSQRTYRNAEQTIPDTFFNSNRAAAYELSPFDETIVIDTDYILQTDHLNNLWGSVNNLMIGLEAVRVDGLGMESAEVRLSDTGPRMYWATVTYFRKCELSRVFFDTVKHVSENWDYYTIVYSLPSKIFRNDYAFSIAAHILNGHGVGDLVRPIPFKLVTATDRDSIHSIDDGITFLVNDRDERWKYHLVKVKTDVHCMNKYSILESLLEHK